MESEKEFLANYRLEDYERPSLTTDVAAFMVSTEDRTEGRRDPENKLRLLLIRRGGHPYKGMWALPGGFLQSGETIEECALRETMEETNVMPAALVPVAAFSKPGRDPRGWVISNAFVSIITEESVKQVGMDDASDAQWFSVSFDKDDEGLYHLTLEYGDVSLKAVLAEERASYGRTDFRIIDNGGLAFDHASIIAAAMTVLRRAAGDYDTIFGFLPEEFTLTSLQRVQETIMNVSVLPGNFRRMIRNYVEETGEYVKGERHRPAKLFRRKK